MADAFLDNARNMDHNSQGEPSPASRTLGRVNIRIAARWGHLALFAPGYGAKWGRTSRTASRFHNSRSGMYRATVSPSTVIVAVIVNRQHPWTLPQPCMHIAAVCITRIRLRNEKRAQVVGHPVLSGTSVVPGSQTMSWTPSGCNSRRTQRRHGRPSESRKVTIRCSKCVVRRPATLDCTAPMRTDTRGKGPVSQNRGISTLTRAQPCCDRYGVSTSAYVFRRQAMRMPMNTAQPMPSKMYVARSM